MRSVKHTKVLREIGLVPTIQRLAVLECLQKTKQHPTADQVLSAVRKKFPSISRATVYNTLDALTKAGMVLRLNVDPTVARYDADLGLHAHFRCRVCQKVYDVELKAGRPIDVRTDGHLVESVRTYAYGVCAACRENEGSALLDPSQKKEPAAPPSPVLPLANRDKSFQKKESRTPSSSEPPSEESNQPKESKTRSASEPPPSSQEESDQKKRPKASSSSEPHSESEESDRTKEFFTPSSPVPPRANQEGGTRNA